MRKNINKSDFEETHGPMNSVSKEDALVWAGAPEVKHLSQLDSDLEKNVRAKKQKAKTSSKKQDRRIARDIIKHIGEING
jgi:hypothetical protein